MSDRLKDILKTFVVFQEAISAAREREGTSECKTWLNKKREKEEQEEEEEGRVEELHCIFGLSQVCFLFWWSFKVSMVNFQLLCDVLLLLKHASMSQYMDYG